MGGKKKQVEQEGLLYPLDEDGKLIGTTKMGLDFLAEMANPVSREVGQRVLKEPDWRHNYPERLIDVLELMSASEENAYACAEAGLRYCYSQFRFVRNGVTKPLSTALDFFAPQGEFQTITILGKNKKPPPIGVPFNGEILRERKFLNLAQRWATTGVVEQSALDAWQWVYRHKKLIKEGMDNTVFVVFGAGSALGPFEPLMRLGANIAAIDLPRKPIWKRLIKLANKSQGGMLFAPSDGETGELGADLLTQLPEIAQWLCELEPSKKLVIGSYAYADGERFVRVALAMDALVQHLVKHRPNKDVTLSYLCSPTDCFLVPEEIPLNARERFEGFGLSSFIRPVLSAASKGKLLQPNYANAGSTSLRDRIADCFVIQQGPNYAIAKRIQHLRAILARRDGLVVSSNIAPASSTESVTKNSLLAAGYGGAQFFPPVEIFEPDTANHVMTLLLLFDTYNVESVANPTTKLANPMELFAHAAVHGGMFRMPYKLRTALESAVALYYMDKYKGVISVSLGALYAYKRSKL